MRFTAINISALPARIVLNVQRNITRFKVDIQRRFPYWFGLPVLGPYIQLYREDGFFKTKLSIFNYCSTFQGRCDVKLEYRISVFDRNGVETGVGKVILETGESSQEYLSDLIDGKLDEYGLFSVMARPIADDVGVMRKLGVTSCQFMTIYCPADSRTQAPQIIHSHKLLQDFRLPKTAVIRESSITEDFSLQNSTEFYFINSCRSVTESELHVLDLYNGNELLRRKIIIPGHGVGRIDLRSTDMFEVKSKAAFKYTFDRSISHQKPIVFRHQQYGVISCNHS